MGGKVCWGGYDVIFQNIFDRVYLSVINFSLLRNLLKQEREVKHE